MKLKKQFKEFHDEIKISDETEYLKEKREVLENCIKNNLPAIFEEHNINLNKSDISFFDQGSYKLRTTISVKPYDRDVGMKIPLNIFDNTDTRKIKKYVRDSLTCVASRTVNIKEPCINVSYVEDEEEWMHIDLPIYAIHNDRFYLARGSEFSTEGNYSWEETDPEGLNNWFLSEFKEKDQLRRIVRYLKKWKYEKYKNSTNSNEIPPSIGLTLLACDNFVAVSSDEGDDDLLSLQKTMENIMNKFSVTYDTDGIISQAKISRLLPVLPYSEVFTKINDCSYSGLLFYKRFKKSFNYITDACNVSSEYDAGVSVQKVFGDDFIIPEKKVASSETKNKREYNFG